MSAEVLCLKSMKIEYLKNPLGIDVLRPRFSWEIDSPKRAQYQAAYRIVVASTKEGLQSGIYDMWDSGRVELNRSSGIEYAGKGLKTSKRYYWKAMIWDKSSMESDWSETAWWEMGLLAEAEWKGKWIGATVAPVTEAVPAPLLRTEFMVYRSIKSARVYICGLGFYEMHINGSRACDNVLDPGYTRYDRTVLYVTHDVTELVKEGKNAVGVELGRGFYALTTPGTWELDKASWRSEPKLLFQMRIEYYDGSVDTVVSDESWKCAEGPIDFDSLYKGEVYDARKEKGRWHSVGYNDTLWENVKIVGRPQGNIKAQMLEPIKIIDTIKPAKVDKSKYGSYVFSFERGITGWARVRMSGEAGTEITIKYGEKLNAEGVLTVESEHIFSQIQVDNYIFKGIGVEEWEPKFSYKGFQFIEISGLTYEPSLDSVEGMVIHSSVETIGEFSCSNILLNKIFNNTCSTILNNLHSIPTDTPVYEKNGWTGDAGLIAETAMSSFNMRNMFAKWMGDIKDCQESSGLVMLIAPGDAWGRWHSPEWASCYVLIPWYLYMYYGDRRILETLYEDIKKFIDYAVSVTDENNVSPSVLGDWIAPGRDGNPPEGAALSATAFLYMCVKTMADIAGALDRLEDKKRFIVINRGIAKDFDRNFFNSGSNIYHTEIEIGYRQTSNVIPLAFKLACEENTGAILENLVDDIIKKDGHLNTGILGTKYILQVLTEYGFGDVAYTIATKTDYPSWGYWIENGATTNWESWETTARSRNHYMFGTIVEWFYKYIAGINVTSPGFDTFRIRPYIVGDLTSAGASIKTVRGPVVCKWEKKVNGAFTMDIAVPVNSTATVYVPAKSKGQVFEANLPAAESDGIRFICMENGHAVFEIGSGSYKLTTTTI